MDVLAIGNALVDVLATVTDEQMDDLGIVKNSYELVDADTADRLYAAMPPAVEISGGAAANTAVGVVSLGGSAAYIGRVVAGSIKNANTSRSCANRSSAS